MKIFVQNHYQERDKHKHRRRKPNQEKGGTEKNRQSPLRSNKKESKRLCRRGFRGMVVEREKGQWKRGTQSTKDESAITSPSGNIN